METFSHRTVAQIFIMLRNIGAEKKSFETTGSVEILGALKNTRERLQSKLASSRLGPKMSGYGDQVTTLI